MTDRAKELADGYYAAQERKLAGEPLTGEILPALDEATVRRMLLRMDGNIARVAGLLDVDTATLRKFVDDSPALRGAVAETFELAVDEAVSVLWQGLRDEGSFQNRFYAAKEFLKTSAGRKRGFGQEASGAATLELKDKGGHKTITLKWLEPKAEET